MTEERKPPVLEVARWKMGQGPVTMTQFHVAVVDGVALSDAEAEACGALVRLLRAGDGQGQERVPADRETWWCGRCREMVPAQHVTTEGVR
jgi:hypothetical protein